MADEISKFFKTIQIMDCEGTKIRVGSRNDGGYILLKELLPKADMLLSFGIGDNWEFESELYGKFPDMQMKLFDPDIHKVPESEFPDDRVSLYCHPMGVGYGTLGLTTVPPDSILKADVEWAEWDALLNASPGALARFSQMVIEFHMVHVEPRDGLTQYFHYFYQNVFNKINNQLFRKYHDVMERLLDKFWIFHIHANNSLPKMWIGDDIAFPPLLEISLVRKDLAGDVKPTEQHFPISWLDAPNKTDRPDIQRPYPVGV